MKRTYSPDIGVQGGATIATQGYFSDINFLIAEDNGFSARILENILRALGARHVKRVTDGVEAVEALNSFPADICFIDWVMPRMNGIEFTNFIRNHDKSPDVFLPIIMVTGLSEIENVMDARDAGVTEYLIKPCSVKQILSRVKSVVENPRSFVRKDDYFGPDRRRRKTSMDETEDRRGKPAAAKKADEASKTGDAAKTPDGRTELNPSSLKQGEVDNILGTSHED